MPEKFPPIKKAIRNGGIWSRGYCVSTIGLNEKAIIEYVTYQDHDDRGAIQIDLGLK
jgi:Transposase IS200 like.